MTRSSIPPIITLTTDFGLTDHYVGTMQGVILGICPDAQIVNITHEIPSFSTLDAAYAIAQSAPYFPAKSIHVVVVDPGVGSSRRAIVVEAKDRLFIGPDNGVFTLVLEGDENAVVREITAAKFCLQTPSTTFHGRDIFAPVAAYLASGRFEPQECGPKILTPVLLPQLIASQATDGHWSGLILSVDRFGNLITNLRSTQLESSLEAGAFALQLGPHRVTKLCHTFSEATGTEPFLYFGSSGYIEIGINQGSAAAVLGGQVGQSISLETPGVNHESVPSQTVKHQTM